MEKIDICLDFDGTCVTHEYPEIGEDIGAIPVLKKLVDSGHNLILFTLRSGVALMEAVEWFNKNEIKLKGIQTNPKQKAFTSSPKAFGNLYIDDSAIGAPLKRNLALSKKEFIDWEKVTKILIEKELIK